MDDMNEDKVPTYQGNQIPLFIKIAWIILITWIIGYLAVYAWPDFKSWFK